MIWSFHLVRLVEAIPKRYNMLLFGVGVIWICWSKLEVLGQNPNFFPTVRGLIFPEEDDGISVMLSSSQQHVIAPSAPHGALSSATSPAQSPATSYVRTRLWSPISTTWLPCQLMHWLSVHSQQNIPLGERNILEFVFAISEPFKLRFSPVSNRFWLSRRFGSNRVLRFSRFDSEGYCPIHFCVKNAFFGTCQADFNKYGLVFY